MIEEVCLKKIGGKQSGPAAELVLSFLIIRSMISIEIGISFIL